MMQLYTAGHVAWDAGIVTAAAAAIRAGRRFPAWRTPLRVSLGLLLAAIELARFIEHDGIRWPDEMPFHLCNVATIMAIIGCFTLAPRAVEFAYFGGVAGAAMALITPDFGTLWPVNFFLNHGALIVAAVGIIYGGIMPLRPGAMWRGYGMLCLYTLCAGVFNAIYGTNYCYLARKPEFGTLLNFLGPWPWYILACFPIALLLCWLLWLPSRWREHAGASELTVSIRSAATSSADA